MIKHLAIIMDGNGRWAAERGEPRLNGHRRGAEKVKLVIESAKEMGIKVLSLYAFSTENFKRDDEEKNGIFDLISHGIAELLPLAIKENLCLRFAGELERLTEPLLSQVVKAGKQTMNNTALTVVIMLAYGGLNEVCRAATAIARQRVICGSCDDVTEEELKANLMTANLPDPDIVVRYGGEMRLSNFLPLQSVYSELMFFKKYWPDFEKEDLVQMAERFDKIQRKFGAVL